MHSTIDVVLPELQDLRVVEGLRRFLLETWLVAQLLQDLRVVEGLRLAG